MPTPPVAARVVNATSERFDIELEFHVDAARWSSMHTGATGLVVTADEEVWLEAMRKLAEAHRDGVDAYDHAAMVERFRRMLHIAMERSMINGLDRERTRAVGVAAALHQLAEFVAMERVLSFQVTWSGGDENPVAMIQFTIGPLTPIVLDLAVIERAGKLA